MVNGAQTNCQNPPGELAAADIFLPQICRADAP
jgi:hypothetical protein